MVSTWCIGNAWANQGELENTLHLDVRDDWVLLDPFTKYMLIGSCWESVDSFCYLGDILSTDGGCESTVITRIRTALGKLRHLLPILASKNLTGQGL